MDEELASLLVKVIPVVVVTLIGVITNLIQGIKNGNLKNLFKKLPAVYTHTSKLIELIEEAETHKAYDGKDKLKYVSTAYHQYCIDNKLVYDEQSVIENIEELVALTKSVNTHDCSSHRL